MIYQIKRFSPLTLLLLLYYGCTIISVDVKPDPLAIKNYSGADFCPFYCNAILSDSLKSKWDFKMYGASTPGHPLVMSDFVIGSDASGRIYYISLKTGKKAGSAKFKGYINGLPAIENSTLVIPVIKITGDKTKLCFYNFSEGSESAAPEIDGRVMAPPARFKRDFLFLTEEGKIYLVNLKGEILMENSIEQFTHSFVLADSSAFYLGTDKGRYIQLSTSGNAVKNIPITDCPLNINLLRDSLLYAFDDNGRFFCINKFSGKIIWKHESGSRMSGAIAADSSYLYFGLTNGFTYCISIADGKTKWQTKTDGMISAAVLVTRNRVVVPNHDYKISILDKETGAIKKEITTEGRARLTPVIYKNYLIAGYDTGVIEVYEMF